MRLVGGLKSENAELLLFLLSMHIVKWLSPVWFNWTKWMVMAMVVNDDDYDDMCPALWAHLWKFPRSSTWILLNVMAALVFWEFAVYRPSKNCGVHSSASASDFFFSMVCLHSSYCFLMPKLLLFLPHLSLSFTVWQRSRELWQVLHTHSAPAHTTRWAGYRQHRPGRVCRLLFHQPTVRTPVAWQQRMRGRGNPPCSLPPTYTYYPSNIWPQLDQRPTLCIGITHPHLFYTLSLPV